MLFMFVLGVIVPFTACRSTSWLVGKDPFSDFHSLSLSHKMDSLRHINDSKQCSSIVFKCLMMSLLNGITK